MGVKGRIFALVLLFAIFGFLIIARLFYWQVIKAEELASLALGQREKVRKIPASRGQILVADNFPLATNKKAYLLFADLTKLKADAKDKIAGDLAPILVTEEVATLSAEEKKQFIKKETSQLENVLDLSDRFWIPLKHKLSLEEKEEIENLKIDGLGFEEEMVRFYPEASMAAHLLGFVGDNFVGEDTGYFGLEGFYNLELKGKAGILTQEKDVSDDPILTGNFEKEERKNGKNLVLFLDRSIQLLVEEELVYAVEKYGAKSGWVIVMEPNTGAILSMASYPAYDPAFFGKYPESFYKNPCISETYEPGSTFKILVMASALNEKLITPHTKCSICDKPFEIDKYVIKTWNDKYYPDQTMTEVLQHSDNVGMVFVAQKLGKEKLAKYLQKFGIGEKTGIDLQEETNVPLKKEDQWSEVDLSTAAFGQGLAVTGIQMARAVATIANGGRLLEPRVVAKIIGQEKTLEIKPKVIREVLTKKTTEQITEMMVNAVEKGEAKWAKPKDYKIAGKTGTAQIPVKGHYDEEKTIASFVGFTPPLNPKFVMLVYLREPSSSPWGSETAAPLFFRIAEKLFLYYGIQPGE